MTPKHFLLLILLLGIFPANIYAEDTTTDSGSGEATAATSDTTDTATTDADTTTTDTAPADDGTSTDEPTTTEEVAASEPETQDVGITATEDQVEPPQFLPSQYNAKIPESPIEEKGSFQTNLYTGSATYTYPIEVPPGTNGLIPSIYLSYSSIGVKGHAGLVGLGWSLTENYIQRDANNTPEDISDDEFDIILNGNKYDLVYDSSDGRYHTKIESYIKIEYKTLSGIPNEKDKYWLVTTKDGTKSRFGYNRDSEHMNSVSGRDYVWRWSLDLVTDTHQNKIYYTYRETEDNLNSPPPDDIGTVYPYQIEYNTDKKRVIEFVLESSDRPDIAIIYNQGSKVKQTRRLKEIVIKADESLVRKYALTYEQNPESTKSLLLEITEYGKDGTPLPSIKFSYNKKSLSWYRDTAYDLSTDLYFSYFKKIKGNKIPTSADRGVRLVDINGDGLVDIIQSLYDADETGNEYYNRAWINSGNGFVRDPAYDPPSDAYFTYFKTYKNNPVSADRGVNLVDINGDGLVDIIQNLYDADKSKYYNRTWINNGSGWVRDPTYDPPSIAFFTLFNISDSQPISADTQVRFGDVDGDGLVDIVQNYMTNDESYTNRTWINTGHGWVRDPTYDPPEAAHFGHFWIKPGEIRASSDMGSRFVDVNGDGLVDILQNTYFKHKDKYYRITWINTGHGWIEDATYAPPTDAHFVYLTWEELRSGDRGVRLADVNGDGLVDIVQNLHDADKSRYYNRAWINNGSGWVRNATYDPPSNLYFSYFNISDSLGYAGDMGVRLADINGDGLVDIVQNLYHGVQLKFYNSAWISHTPLPDLLSGITTEIGGKYSFDYTPSTKFDNTGADGISDLPYLFWVVNRTTIDNGMTGDQHTEETYTYEYANGLYDHEDKEFRGFGDVKVTDKRGTTTEHYFHQDDARKGREYKTVIEDGAGNPYTKTENTWSSSINNGIYTVTLDKTLGYTYDGVLSGPKITDTRYYYDSYGNIIKASYLGDTSTNSDNREETRDYYPNTNDWIVDRVARVILKDSGGQDVSKSWYYYDGNTAWNTAPSSKGELTKEENWLSTGTNPVTEYEYGSYGNPISVIDPNGHSTLYGYDTATHTFPVRITNAKGQSTDYTYDLGTGNLLSTTDPNSYTTSYTYDVFGRIKKEIRPYDSTGYPTKTYTYSLDGTAPESVKVSQREQSGTANTLDTYTFVDGLGRVIQTRIDAENSSEQIVQDTFYNEIGTVENQSAPYLGTKSTGYVQPDMTKPGTDLEYDPIGRNILVRNTDDTVKTTAFDHWKVTSTDENGNQKVYYLDAYSRIKQVDEKNQGSTYTTTYEYDTLDNLVKITDDHNNVFSFSFDSLGRKTGIDDPDMGVWNYTYDGVGNLITQTNANETITNFIYDELNRVKKRYYNNDQNSWDLEYYYDRENGHSDGLYGTLTEILDALGSTRYYYDQRLRKIKEVMQMDGITQTTEWSYDSADRITSQNDPTGETLNLGYNTQGEIDNVGNVVTNIDYNALNKITRRDYGNSKTSTLTYNTDDFRLNRILTSGLQDLSYDYDNVGNVISRIDARDGTTETFGYDDLDRLTSAVETDGYSRSYEYDSIGNILSMNDSGMVINFEYGENAGPHAVTWWSKDKIPPAIDILSPESKVYPVDSVDLRIEFDEMVDKVTYNWDGEGDVISYSGTTYLNTSYGENWDYVGEKPDTSTVSLWHFNGDAKDSSGNWNDGIINGDASYVNGKVGQGLSFDGDGDYVKISSPSNLPTGSVVTITAWINPSSTQNGGAYNGIVSYGPRGCTGTSILLSLQSNGRPSMATWCNDFVPSSGPVVNWNQWNFIAVVLDGQSITLYVNDQSVDGTLSSLPDIQSGVLNIGSTDNPGRFFNGTIDEVQIYNRPLSAEEIQKIYDNSNHSKVLSMHLNENNRNTTHDSSPNGNDGQYYGETMNDGVINGATWTDGKFGSGLEFDGVDDYVEVTHSSSIDFNLGDSYSISAWVYPSGSNGTSRAIVEKWEGGNIPYPYVIRITNGDKFTFNIYNSTTSNPVFTSSTISLNAWYHVVGVNNGTHVLLYVNGVLNATDEIRITGDISNTIPLYLGIRGNMGTPFNGTIDEVRIWNRALTLEEIQAEMESFVPITRPVASWSFNEGSGDTLYDSHIWQAGNFGSALSFDGADDYVEIPKSSSLNLTYPITLAAWTFPSSTAQYMEIISDRGAGTAQYDMRLKDGVDLEFYYRNGSNWYVFTKPNAVSLNQWNFVSVTYNGSKIDLYVDGIKVQTNTTDKTPGYNSQTTIRIGTWGAGNLNFFNGTIDEVAIYDRALSTEEIQEIYNKSLSEGPHNITVSAMDLAGNTNQVTRYFTVDTTKPVIDILSPQNTTYNDAVIDLIVSANEPIDTWMYSLDGNQNRTFIGWNTSWGYKNIINVTTTAALEEGYTVNISFDHFNLVSDGKSNASGKDIRIIWYNESSSNYVELDRINTTNFNMTDTTIWFKIQEDISAGGLDSNYYLYYGNSSAGAPPVNASEVYAFYDDFNDYSTSDVTEKGKWEVYSTGAGTTSITNGVLETDSDTSYKSYGVKSTESVTLPALFEFDHKNFNAGSGDAHGVFFIPEFTIGYSTANYGNNFYHRYKGGLVSVSASNANWNHYIYTSIGATSRLIIEDIAIDNSITHDSNIDGYNAVIRLYGHHNGKSQWDNIRVRKYVSPEPTTSLGAEGILSGLLGPLSDGPHNITVYAIDLAGNTNQTTVHFTVEATPPTINITSPENTTYSTDFIDLNYTVNDSSGVDWVGYSLDGGDKVTLIANTTLTLTNLPDGLHYVTVYANDTLGNMGSSTVWFTVDTTPPTIIITSPENITYPTDSVDLNYTVNDASGVDWVGYSLDEEDNVTLIANTTLIGLRDGTTHNVTVYANDTEGHMNSSTVYFTVKLPVHNLDTGLNYSTIQAAIDAVETLTGHTIQVDAGTHNENVDVTKSLNIVGSGAGVTIVSAASSSDHVFEVTVNSVNISGFTVKGATYSYAGIYLYLASYADISNNTASNNYYGIRLSSSNNNTITNNTASNNGYYGIRLSSSSNNTITNNIANSNNWYEGYGIYLDSSGNNTLTGNTMSANTYNFGIYGDEGSHFIQTIDPTNTVNGKLIYYLVGVSNTVINSSTRAGYVGVVNGINVIVKDLILTKNGQGVLFVNTLNSSVLNVTASNNENGIYLYSSSNNTITNNIASYNYDEYSGGGGNGISLYSSSYNTLEGNIVSGNDYGITLWSSSSNNTITNNTANSNYLYGIYLGSSSNNTITNNIASYNSYGIYLESSSYNTITNNTANSNTFWGGSSGISLYSSNYNTLESNIVSDNDYGIYLDSSSSNTITNNTANSNYLYGIYLESSSNNTITSNTANSNNYFGIYLDTSSNNSIYNNYFNNTNNFDLSSSTNDWNTTKTPGTNIIGGPYLGGNFWAKPDGTGFSETCSDTDADGICDSGYTLASGNVDYLPLTIPGSIGSCTTITSPGTYVLNQDLYSSSTCITIKSSDVIFDGQGHTIDGPYAVDTYGIYVYNSSATLTNVTVKNVKVTNWDYGIYYQNVENGRITDNIANYNYYNGIYLYSSSNNNLTNNTANSNTYNGIHLSDSSNNTITNNTASNNYDEYSGGGGDGIYLYFSSYNTITGNIASDNSYGIYLYSSSNNTLEGNTANYNSGIMGDGMGITLYSSSSNTIINNNANSNNYFGISLDYSSNNTISNNTALGNWESGIYLGSSSSNTITNNTASDNDYGIYLESSSSNTIYNNLFNNTNNVDFYGSNINDWNTTNSTGPNIGGGPYLGGNFWAKPDGTGFSETCSDTDADGICDSGYTLASGNVDYLPLSLNFTEDMTPPNINITSPENTTTNDSIPLLNATMTDTNPDKMWYSLDGGTNSSVYSGGFIEIELGRGHYRPIGYENSYYVDNPENAYDNNYDDTSTYAYLDLYNSDSNVTYTWDTDLPGNGDIILYYTWLVYVYGDSMGITAYNYSSSSWVYLRSIWESGEPLAKRNLTLSSDFVNSTGGIMVEFYAYTDIANDAYIELYDVYVAGSTVPKPLDDGQHNVTVYATDTQGNTNSSTVWFTIDTTPPTYSNLTPQNNSNTSDSGQDISIIITDEGSDINAGSLSMTVAGNYYDTNSGKLSYDTNSGLLTYFAAEGEFTDGQAVDVIARAKDNAGNQLEVIWSFIVNLIPQITILSPPNTTITDTTPDLNLTVSEPSNITYSWDNKGNITGCQNCTSYITTYGEYANSSEQNLSIALHFNENFYTTVHDDSGNGNDGDLINTPTWVSTDCKFGSCLHLDGTDDYVEIPYSDSLNFSDYLTVSFWVNINGSTGANQYLASQGTNTGSWKWAILYNNANSKVVFYVHNGTGSTSKATTSGITQNAWHHIVTTFNSTDLLLYHNGVLNASATTGVNIRSDISPPVQVGTRFATNANWLNGSIDEVIIWNRTLSAKEIQNLYNKTLSDGQHIVTVYANDTAGNVGHSTVWFTVQTDTTPPTVENSSTSDIMYGEDETVTVDAYDLNGISTVILRLDSTTDYEMTYVSGNTYTVTIPAVDLPGGMHSIRYYVNDTAGNMNSSVTDSFYVNDTIPPTIIITSPQNTTYTTDSVDLDYTVDDSSGVDWVGYSLDGQGNITLIVNTTLTNLSDGQHNVTVYANDTAGNVGHSTVWFTVDTIPPTTTDDYDGLWHTSDITITLTATDTGGSGVDETYYKINSGAQKNVSAAGQPVISTEGSSNTLEYWSVDVATNEELPHNMLTDIKLDKTAPTVKNSSTSDIMYGEDETVTVDAYDLNGISTVILRLDSSTDYVMAFVSGNTYTVTIPAADLTGGTHSIRYYVNDTAGNMNSSVTDSFYVNDTIPPTIIITSPENKTYPTDSVDLNYTVNDSSGVDWVGYSLDGQGNITLIVNTTLTNLSNGQHNVTVYANDTAGNLGSSTVWFTVDTIPPTTTHDYDGLWHTSDITITLNATDTDGSGVDETYYKINGGAQKNVSADGQPVITIEGASNTLEYWSVDVATNEELPHNMLTDIKLDKTAPTTTDNAASGWQNADVTVNLTPTDIGDSGLADTFYCVDQTNTCTPSTSGTSVLVSEDGTNYVRYYSVDVAGNSENVKNATVKIDNTAPTINITSPENTTYYSGDTIDLNYTVNDSRGIDWVVYSLDGGDNVSLVGEITKFSDSTGGDLGTAENLAFASDGGSNASAYIKLPKNATVTSASLNVSNIYGYTGFNFSVSSESSDINGLTWDGTYLWTLSWGSLRAYRYYPNGTYTGFSFFYDEGADARGLTWDGTYLWLVSRGTGRVHRYYPNGTYTGFNINTFLDETEEDPEGITWDGTSLWITGIDSYDVHRYYPNGTYTGFNFSVSGSTGLTWDGTYFWVADRDTDRVRRYYSNGTYTGFNFSVSNPYSLASSGAYLWMGRGSTVYKYINPDVNNFSLSVNGTEIWSISELNSKNSPQQITNLTNALNSCISNNVADANGYVNCQLNFTSATSGIVQLDALSVRYNSSTTLINLSDSQHSVTVYANDTVGNMGSSTVWFTISTALPSLNITILSPPNATIIDTTPDLNLTVGKPSNITYAWNNEGNITGCQNCTSYITTYGEYANSSEQNLSIALHFNENTSTTVHDDSGNGNDGTLTGQIWAPGKFASGLDFSKDEYLTIPHSDSQIFNDSFSISFWITFKEDNRGQWIISKLDGTASWAGFHVDRQSNNNLRFMVHNTTGANSNLAYPVSNNTRYHVVLIRDKTASKLRLYLNGTSVKNTTSSITGLNVNTSKQLVIGAKYNFGNRLNATLDEVLIFNRALGDTEISKLFNKTLSEGQHKVTVYANDTAANIDSSRVWFTVDTTPPTYSNLTPQNNSNTSDSGQDISIIITGEGSDVNAGSLSMTVAGNYYDTNSGKLSYDTNTGLLTYHAADGEFTDGQVVNVIARARDNAGNLLEVIWSFIVDLILQITILSPPNETITDTTPDLNLTVSEPSRITYSWDNEGNITGCQNCTSYITTYGESMPDANTAVLLMHFNENIGDTTYDDSSNQNDGTINGDSVVWTTGRFGNALSFNGSDDFVKVPNSNSFDVDEITIETWVYPDYATYPAGNMKAFISRVQSYILGMDKNTGNLGIWLYNGSYYKHRSLTQIPLKNWSHVAFTYKYPVVKLYLDGEEVYSGEQTSVDFKTTYPTRVGRCAFSGMSWNGTIDEVSILDRALNATEIAATYNASLVPGPHSVTVYAKDVSDNRSSTMRWFSVDTTP